MKYVIEKTKGTAGVNERSGEYAEVEADNDQQAQIRAQELFGDGAFAWTPAIPEGATLVSEGYGDNLPEYEKNGMPIYNDGTDWVS